LGTHDGVLDGVVDEVQRLLVADQVPQPVAGQQQAVVLGIQREARDLRLRRQAARLQIAVAQGPGQQQRPCWVSSRKGLGSRLQGRRGDGQVPAQLVECGRSQVDVTSCSALHHGLTAHGHITATSRRTLGLV